MDSTDSSATGGPRPVYQRYVDAVQRGIRHVWDWLDALTRGYATYLAQAAKNFSTQGAREAVVFGYWAMFSLFPLVMLGVALATFALGPEGAKAQIYSFLSQFFPGVAGQLIRDNIDIAISQRGSFGILGVVGLVYGATGLFTNLQWELSRIFRDKVQRPWPIQVIIGLIMMAVFAILLITSVFVSATFRAVGLEFLGQSSPLFQIGAALIPLGVNWLIFVLLFRYIPRRNISWRALLPAALLGAFVWELAKNVFGWYLANLANFGAVYGSLGTVMGLLTWTNLTGALLSLCAEIAVATDDWMCSKPPAVAMVTPSVNKPANELPQDDPGKVKKPGQGT